MRRAWLLPPLLALLAAGCLSARSNQRSYYVMHGEPRDPIAEEPIFNGLVRVRNMDTDAVYEKFQIVVRKSPYQLRYSDQNVWAVKPNQMVADLVALELESARLFSAVTRDLIDARPKYTLAGKLHSVEVYDSDELWFAHLELTLYLTRFRDGDRIWSMDFDQRKQIISGDFGHAARALSELFSTAMTQALAELAGLEEVDVQVKLPAPDPSSVQEKVDPHAPVLVPHGREREREPREKRRREAPE